MVSAVGLIRFVKIRSKYLWSNYCFFFPVLTGRLWYPVSQSVCGESLRSSSHSGDAASRLPQGQVRLCDFRGGLDEFRQRLSQTLTHCRHRSLSLAAFCAVFLVFLYTAVSCNSPVPVVSPEKATSPWWPGSAAPGWRCAGSTGPKTNQCSACARPPRGHVQWWAAVTCPILAIWAAIHSFNRVLDHSHGRGSQNWFSEASKFALAD